MLDTIAKVMVSPINQSFLIAAIGLIVYLVSKRRRKKLSAMFVGLGFAWFLLCSQFFFSHLLMAPLENAYPPIKLEHEKWHKADGIWVLACYHFDAEDLPLVSQFNHCSLERLIHAASMYKAHPKPIYLTGGNFVKQSPKMHAEQAAALLVSLGVLAEDIQIISQGHDTWQEAKQISANKQFLAVVSSASHGRRIGIMLNALQVDHVFVPVHYSIKGDNIFLPNLPSIYALSRSERAMYEYAAIVKFSLFK